MPPKSPSSFKDLFSKQAADYARYRPRYPAELFSFLAELSSEKNLAWDCATGNGQAALGLAPHFSRVIATDAAEKQLKRAEAHPRIEYQVAPAEASGLADQSVDLVTVAQALHWFDRPRFFAECARVLKPQGLLAIWTYGLATISPEIDQVVLRLYRDILGPYWDKERALVDQHYAGIEWPFDPITPPEFQMRERWGLDHYFGYLKTWSAVQKCAERTSSDPLALVRDELARAWGNAGTHLVRWPLTLYVRRNIFS